jgi:hypothetical protein
MTFPGGVCLISGILLALEAAAQAIGPAVHGAGSWAGLFSPFDGARWLGSLNMKCIVAPGYAHWTNPHNLKFGAHALSCATPLSVIHAIDWRSGLLFLGGFVPFAGFRIAEKITKATTPHGRTFAPVRYAKGERAPLVFPLGKATGVLRKLGAESGIARGQAVRFVGEDINRDVFAVGGKGEGKTTGVLNPILYESLLQDCGALIFNVKGDYDQVAVKLAERAGRVATRIGFGPDARQINLLSGMSPEMCGTFMSSLLLLIGNKEANAVFWNQQAAIVTRAVLGMLYYIPYFYSFPGFYRYLFVKADRLAMEQRIEDLVEQLLRAATQTSSEADRRELFGHVRYIEGCRLEIRNFEKQTDQIRSGVHGQLNQILSSTVVPELEQAYFNTSLDTPGFSFEDLYEKGDVIIVNCPIQDYGLAASAIMCFMKLRFYVTMEQRRMRPGANQTRQVGLHCDEHHEIAAASKSGLSDPVFVAKSRDTGTFCVFATQSISALNDRIGHDATKAFLANVRQKFMLRNEDKDTIEDMLWLLGTVETEQESESETRQPGSWGKSKGTTKSKTRHAVVDPSLVRNLKPREALCLLTIDNQSADDVIQLTQVFA